MRLSEAIRLGAMLRPQAFGRAFRHGKSCALGAALEAAGVDYNGRCQRVDRLVEPRWPWADASSIIRCPACSQRLSCPGEVIVHLNDSHSWTREAIADWVAAVEPPDDPPVSADAVREDVEFPRVASRA